MPRDVSRVRIVKHAFWTVVEIVGNAVVCTLVAWLTSYVWSLGSVYFGSPVKAQLRASFLAGALASSHVMSAAMAVATQTFVLCSVHSASGQAHPPSMVFYALRLLVECRVMFVVTLLLYVSMSYAVSLAPASVQAYKLEFYVMCIFGHLTNTTVSISTRRIIKANIARPQPASLAPIGVVGRSSVTPAPPTLVVQPQIRPSRARRVFTAISSTVSTRARWSIRYAKIYAQMFTVHLPLVSTGLYVHLAIQFRVLADSTGLFLFVIGSLVLKVMSQEGAKMVLARKKVSDIRAMCVAVGLPPIILDTQVRIVLQYAQSSTTTVYGILGLGGIEIAMRVGKLLWLKAQIRRHTKVQITSVAPQPAEDNGTDWRLGRKRPPHVHVTTVTSWERRAWKMHMAELYTDMSAEYLAIGCSTCFLYCFGTHPKYMLSRTLSSAASRSVEGVAVDYASVSDWDHVLRSLGVQVAVEMLVDFLSSVVEVSAGTNFEQLSAYRLFVLAFFAHAAIASIQISGIMYLL